MLPLFATPWAFLALLAVPALVVIYWLRHRFRRVPVSSLMLWRDQHESRQGGLRVRRVQTPLLFFLELLALLLLIAAAAGPYAASADGNRPLVVVLDDSFSMLAGGKDSARDQGRAAVAEEVRRRHRPAVRFVLAGDQPQVLGEPARTAAEALGLLDGWRCRAPASRLDAAIALAGEVGGSRALILVVSDHAPAAPPDKGRVQWWAFGAARPNIAFVNAQRTWREGKERCWLEIANLAPHAQTMPLVVEAGPAAQVVHRDTLTLAAGEVRRVALQLPADTPALHARLGPDALEIDNEVTLLPEPHQPVRVEVRVPDAALRALVEKALKATRQVVLTATAPDLVFTTGAEERPGGESWQVQIEVAENAEAYVGPFVLDRNHPLTEGLDLHGVVWAAGKGGQPDGAPVILAGSVPLLTDTEDATGGHALRLRLRPDLSNLPDSPTWPILIWNIVQWRAGQRPGLRRTNLRLGEAAVLTVPGGADIVEVTGPDGSTRPVPVHGRRAVVRAEAVGRYEMRAGEQRYPFAVNALNRDESDLSGCMSGRWGEWVADATEAGDRRFAWVLLFVAALVLTLHLMLVAGAARKAAP